ncbi:class I SAM-dependent methyltransferase [Maricaulis alexandrii]|jgi:SAM-dependent methyltransferase|uniref:class I SAM-dependent methyltransferase n=1 Tax=Maricaulis alexandrii TaxID=2570354 RepID=UPI001109EC12|nr:class I SAM-dependent methyltransferase [Maricaulis alexandrii]
MENLDILYRHRFAESDLPEKNKIWSVLCSSYFNKLVGPDDTVLDLACGFGEFINNIKAKKKLGVDINPDSPGFLNEDVTFVRARSDELDGVADDSVDVVFTSNFLEHLESKAALMATFKEIKRVLKPGGRFIIMGPNIRYVYDKYWDFLDHHLPLSHVTIDEALNVAGFETETIIGRFLPYSTRSALPKASWIISLYLKLPFAWPLFGKQFLVTARKPS